MLNHIKTILITALLTILVVDGAQATMPYVFNNFHTHSTPLALEPLSSNGTKVAGVYWLPDYLEKNIDFNDRSQGVNCTNPGASDYNPNHPACKKVDERECKTLGYEIPSFVTDLNKYNYTEFLAANKVRCYKNFSCKSSYSKNSCDAYFKLAGNSCTDSRGTFYERCDPVPCASGYTAGITTCSPQAGYTYVSSGYSGTKICGKCTAKACASGSTSSSCGNGYTAQANGSYSGSSPCYSCVANACTGYGSKNEGSGWNCSDTCLAGTTTKYKCIAKTCAEGSLTPNCDSVNYNTVNTSSYSGASVCKKCEAKACPISKDCTYGCKTWDTTRQSMCGKICTECLSCAPGGSATCSGQSAACGLTYLNKGTCTNCNGATLNICEPTIYEKCYVDRLAAHTVFKGNDNSIFSATECTSDYEDNSYYGYTATAEVIGQWETEQAKIYDKSSCTLKSFNGLLYIGRDCHYDKSSKYHSINHSWLVNTAEAAKNIKETVWAKKDGSNKIYILNTTIPTLDLYDISKNNSTMVNCYDCSVNKLIIDGNVDNKSLNIDNLISNITELESKIDEALPYSTKVHKGRVLNKSMSKLEKISLISGGMQVKTSATKGKNINCNTALTSLGLKDWDIKFGAKAKLLIITPETPFTYNDTTSNKPLYSVCRREINVSGEFETPYTKAFIAGGKILTPITTSGTDSNGNPFIEISFKESFTEDETINYVHGIEFSLNYSNADKHFSSFPQIINMDNFRNGAVSYSSTGVPLTLAMKGNKNILSALLFSNSGQGINIKGNFTFSKNIQNFTIYKGTHTLNLSDGVTIYSNRYNIFSYNYKMPPSVQNRENYYAEVYKTYQEGANIYFPDSETSTLKVNVTGTAKQCDLRDGSCRKICSMTISNKTTSWETAKCTCSAQDLNNGFIQLEKECLKPGPCSQYINNIFWKPKGSNCGGIPTWIPVPGVPNVTCGGITYEQCA